MKRARYLHASVGLDGFLYVIGGHDGEERLRSIEKYNPDTNSWTDFQPMLKKLSSPTAVACSGQLFVIGASFLIILMRILRRCGNDTAIWCRRSGHES